VPGRADDCSPFSAPTIHAWVAGFSRPMRHRSYAHAPLLVRGGRL